MIFFLVPALFSSALEHVCDVAVDIMARKVMTPKFTYCSESSIWSAEDGVPQLDVCYPTAATETAEVLPREYDLILLNE
jgi:hypothetical protein